MISLSSQAGLWMMMIFGTHFCVSFLQTHPRDAVRSAWTSLLVWDVWASLLNPSKPRIFPLWLLLKMAGSAIRDDKIVLGAVMNGFVCRCSASPLPQLFTPRQGEVLTERHVQVWRKGLSPGSSRRKKHRAKYLSCCISRIVQVGKGFSGWSSSTMW